MCLTASAPFNVVGSGAAFLAVLIALSKRSIQAKTFGYLSLDTKVGGRAPFKLRAQWKGQMAVVDVVSLKTDL